MQEACGGFAGGGACTIHALTHRTVVAILLFVVVQFIGGKGLFILYVFALLAVELVVFYVSCYLFFIQRLVVLFRAITRICNYYFWCLIVLFFMCIKVAY